MMMRVVVQIAIFFATSLAAYSSVADETWQSGYGIGKGSMVVLHVPLTIDVLGHQVFIQGGEVRKDYAHSYNLSYDQYYPFCYFEIRTPSNQTQTILPGEFEITRVTADETEVVQQGPTRVASFMSSGRALSQIVELLIFELHSKTQMNVEKLVCADGFNNPAYVVMPTLRQVRDTLGQVATLELVR